MFSAKTYAARRNMLRTKIGSGIVLFPGNPLSPNNYPNNAYYFRQDSSFLYYFGLNIPSLAGLIDADTGEEALYGDDFTVEDIIWSSNRSRIVPPPMAVTKPTTYAPNQSNRLAEARRMPLMAKANVPMKSSI